MSTFDDDLTNAQNLVDALGVEHHKYIDAWSLSQQLKENIDKANNYGDLSDTRADRTRIRNALNAISIEVYKATIDEIAVKAKQEPGMPLSARQIQEPPKTNPISNTKNGKLIFISHTTQDDEFVARLADDLTKAGFNMWHDGKDIKVSQSIPEAINKGLMTCDYFALVLTPESVASHWVSQELDSALAGKKVILPILLKNCERPPLIQAIKYADFRNNYADGLKSIMEFLTGQADVESTPALKLVFGIIEQTRNNGDLSPAQKNTLKQLILSIALKKQRGEKIMPPLGSENTSEMFAYASQALIYDLLSLSDYHAEWPHLVISDSFKKNSVKLLGKMKDQVLVSSALVQQVTRQDVSDETECVLTPLQSLQTVLRNMDDYLLSGKVPYHVQNEIERCFDDLTFHLNKYLLILHELANSPNPSGLIQ